MDVPETLHPDELKFIPPSHHRWSLTVHAWCQYLGFPEKIPQTFRANGLTNTYQLCSISPARLLQLFVGLSLTLGQETNLEIALRDLHESMKGFPFVFPDLISSAPQYHPISRSLLEEEPSNQEDDSSSSEDSESVSRQEEPPRDEPSFLDEERLKMEWRSFMGLTHPLPSDTEWLAHAQSLRLELKTLSTDQLVAVLIQEFDKPRDLLERDGAPFDQTKAQFIADTDDLVRFVSWANKPRIELSSSSYWSSDFIGIEGASPIPRIAVYSGSSLSITPTILGMYKTSTANPVFCWFRGRKAHGESALRNPTESRGNLLYFSKIELTDSNIYTVTVELEKGRQVSREIMINVVKDIDENDCNLDMLGLICAQLNSKIPRPIYCIPEDTRKIHKFKFPEIEVDVLFPLINSNSSPTLATQRTPGQKPKTFCFSNCEIASVVQSMTLMKRGAFSALEDSHETALYDLYNFKPRDQNSAEGKLIDFLEFMKKTGLAGRSRAPPQGYLSDYSAAGGMLWNVAEQPNPNPQNPTPQNPTPQNPTPQNPTPSTPTPPNPPPPNPPPPNTAPPPPNTAPPPPNTAPPPPPNQMPPTQPQKGPWSQPIQNPPIRPPHHHCKNSKHDKHSKHGKHSKHDKHSKPKPPKESKTQKHKHVKHKDSKKIQKEHNKKIKKLNKEHNKKHKNSNKAQPAPEQPQLAKPEAQPAQATEAKPAQAAEAQPAQAAEAKPQAPEAQPSQASETQPSQTEPAEVAPKPTENKPSKAKSKWISTDMQRALWRIGEASIYGAGFSLVLHLVSRGGSAIKQKYWDAKEEEEEEEEPMSMKTMAKQEAKEAFTEMFAGGFQAAGGQVLVEFAERFCIQKLLDVPFFLPVISQLPVALVIMKFRGSNVTPRDCLNAGLSLFTSAAVAAVLNPVGLVAGLGVTAITIPVSSLVTYISDQVLDYFEGAGRVAEIRKHSLDLMGLDELHIKDIPLFKLRYKHFNLVLHPDKADVAQDATGHGCHDLMREAYNFLLQPIGTAPITPLLKKGYPLPVIKAAQG